MNETSMIFLAVAILALSLMLTDVILRLNRVIAQLNAFTSLLRAQKESQVIKTADMIVTAMGYKETK